jgi:hypothetical protein
MAGHQKGDKKYFVPRTLVPLDLEIDDYCVLLLPKLRRWRAQATGPRGDKSTCCDTFLNNLIPYFVEVVVQDGIYFVSDFPDHPMSHLLKVSIYYGFLLLSNNFSPCYLKFQNKLPNYERWAARQRIWVDEKIKSRDVDEVSALEAASKGAFYSIHRRMDGIETTMASNSARLAKVERTNQTLLEQNSTMLGMLQQLTGRSGDQSAAPAPAAAAAPPREGESFFVFNLSLSFVC